MLYYIELDEQAIARLAKRDMPGSVIAHAAERLRAVRDAEADWLPGEKLGPISICCEFSRQELAGICKALLPESPYEAAGYAHLCGSRAKWLVDEYFGIAAA